MTKTPLTPAALKQALANVSAGIEAGQRERLMSELYAAYKKLGHAEPLSEALFELVLHLEPDSKVSIKRLEELVERVQSYPARSGPGRPPKVQARAVAEAQTAVAVDQLMKAESGLSLEQACRKIAFRTQGQFRWKRLKDLRAKIMRGPPHSSSEAHHCYMFHLLFDDELSLDDPPLPITPERVGEIWAEMKSKT